MDRLGRSLGDLTHLTNELKSRNVEFWSLTEKVETGSSTQKQLFDKMWQLPDIEKINLSEGRAVKELAPVTPAPAQNITQQEAYEIAKDSYVSAARN